MKDRNVSREKVVIATKITGGRNVTPKNIKSDCEGSLKRLGTDYIDIYQLHWPARYSPQSNWGQSLKYNLEIDSESSYWRGFGGPTTFEELCVAMEDLIQEGKIRGWGLCNDNAYGLTGMFSLSLLCKKERISIDLFASCLTLDIIVLESLHTNCQDDGDDTSVQHPRRLLYHRPKGKLWVWCKHSILSLGKLL